MTSGPSIWRPPAQVVTIEQEAQPDLDALQGRIEFLEALLRVTAHVEAARWAMERDAGAVLHQALDDLRMVVDDLYSQYGRQ